MVEYYYYVPKFLELNSWLKFGVSISQKRFISKKQEKKYYTNHTHFEFKFNTYTHTQYSNIFEYNCMAITACVMNYQN